MISGLFRRLWNNFPCGPKQFPALDHKWLISWKEGFGVLISKLQNLIFWKMIIENEGSGVLIPKLWFLQTRTGGRPPRESDKQVLILKLCFPWGCETCKKKIARCARIFRFKENEFSYQNYVSFGDQGTLGRIGNLNHALGRRRNRSFDIKTLTCSRRWDSGGTCPKNPVFGIQTLLFIKSETNRNGNTNSEFISDCVAYYEF